MLHENAKDEIFIFQSIFVAFMHFFFEQITNFYRFIGIKDEKLINKFQNMYKL